MRDLKNLKVALLAHEVAVMVYALTSAFPAHERYGLASQLRRAAVSIASNIAEGSGRGGDREFLRFLYIALGSATELAVQLDLAIALELVSADEAASLMDRINHLQRMLNRFTVDRRRALRRSPRADPASSGLV